MDLLNSIVNKIATGRSDCTLDELQYQKNYPQEIERALLKKSLKIPIQCNSDGFMIIPYKWNLSMQKRVKNIFNIKRFLFAPEAVSPC